MAEYHVDVAGFLLSPTVATDDYAFHVAVTHVLRVAVDNGGHAFDFRAGDLEEELVVEFQARLLRLVQLGPAVRDDVVEIAPAAVVEVLCSFGAYAPNVVEEVEDLELCVRFGILDGSKSSGVFELAEEKGNPVGATW